MSTAVSVTVKRGVGLSAVAIDGCSPAHGLPFSRGNAFLAVSTTVFHATRSRLAVAALSDCDTGGNRAAIGPDPDLRLVAAVYYRPVARSRAHDSHYHRAGVGCLTARRPSVRPAYRPVVPPAEPDPDGVAGDSGHGLRAGIPLDTGGLGA